MLTSNVAATEMPVKPGGENTSNSAVQDEDIAVHAMAQLAIGDEVDSADHRPAVLVL